MYNIIDLTNKTVVITGAASGIGWETAIVVSKVEARVMIDNSLSILPLPLYHLCVEGGRVA